MIFLIIIIIKYIINNIINKMSEEDDDDFWKSNSVARMCNHNNEICNFIDDDYQTKKVVLPNLGYIDKSHIFKFNTKPKDTKIPQIVKIKLLKEYNFYIDNINIIFDMIPKEEYFNGLCIEIKYLKSISISKKKLSLYLKKFELYVLGLPIEDETYINLGFKIKKDEDNEDFSLYTKKRNKKYEIDNLIDNLIDDK
jgi:hypothetical protein